ncbi:hypothetical protein [Dactylosporangium salmoneum]|uniref:Uncharacterized protein n=1 Tax=Dactylosporangium salmoneum TaxID=53361 RepID=A0ABP5TUL9_9ACTN
MAELSSNNGARTGRWSGPVPCSRDAGPVPIRIGSPTQVTQSVDDLEAAALLRAFNTGNASLREALPGIRLACDLVINRFQEAAAAIDRVATFRAVGSAAEACRQREQMVSDHADDGPEDLRRRSIPKWLVWAVLAIASVFDGQFVGSLVQRILDLPDGSLFAYLAYLPAVGMALCLLLAGDKLAEHLFRRRARVTRRRLLPALNPVILLRRIFWEWRPEPLERHVADLPWPRLTFPVLAAASTVGLLGVAAYVRATTAGAAFDDLADYRWAFVVILLLLSVSAIGVKVQSHNPFADRADAVARGVERARTRSERDIDAAREALGEHGKAWNALQSAISGAKGRAREVFEEGCAAILEDRGRNGVGGRLPLPLVRLRWPRDDERLATEPDDDEPQLPDLNLAVLRDARDVAQRYSHGRLEERLNGEVAQLHAQFAVVVDRGSRAAPQWQQATGTPRIPAQR